MVRYSQEDHPLPLVHALDAMTVGDLKPLVKLVQRQVPTRKGDLVAALTNVMTDVNQVRALYKGLDELGQRAVQEAAHDPRGWLHKERFKARYGQMPAFSTRSADDRYYYGYGRGDPTVLALFFPRYNYLPTDLRQLLLPFVPPPPEYAIPTVAEIPATVTFTRKRPGGGRSTEERSLTVRHTAPEACQDLKAVLRLVEARQVRITDRKRQPTDASRRAVREVLCGGDFYAPEDEARQAGDPAHDLGIKAFAWPMIVQTAGLAERLGNQLALTAAGKKALARPAHETIRSAWRKWRTTRLLDEFSRVEAIKGQSGNLTALTERRKAVFEGLAACPAGQWFLLDDFFRFLRATDRGFEMSHRAYKLYLGQPYYGDLDDYLDTWTLLQGRYILAVLFEYAATLGLIDVGYLAPQRTRREFYDDYGAEVMTYLSRYDGLMYARINPLGAWCLGLADTYRPAAPEAGEAVQVLANFDVVVRRPPLPAADRLLLERYAEPRSEAVYHLDAGRIQDVQEQGGSLDDLEAFLKVRNEGPLPETVQVFLNDQRRRAGRLRDLGPARLIECEDATLAQMLAGDPQLKGRCQLAGERCLVFPAGEEAAIRRALRKLGHVLPPPAG